MSLYTRIIDVQKMEMAWEKVRKNKPAAGIDNVTWEMYDENKKENIKQLNIELSNHEYRPLPVKIVKIYKGEKAREIALYSMRDKNVQQAISIELTKMYDNKFSECAFAYRHNKSALVALETIEEKVQQEKYRWFLKTDIKDFFGTIHIGQLRRKLEKEIKEDDVIDLILNDCTTPELGESGELIKKKQGIYQGSAIAPILSNIYMLEFDYEVEKIAPFYIRYSDDILVLAESKEKIQEIVNFMMLWMEKLGLCLNDKKTLVGTTEAGFHFLGYDFSCIGKTIPKKAEEHLEEKLETVWYEHHTLAVEERIKRCSEILDGWNQYFKGERKVSSMVEYATILYMLENKKIEIPQTIVDDRCRMQNVDKSLCMWLTQYWKKRNCHYQELWEYENFYQLSDSDNQIEIEEPYLTELLELFRKLSLNESIDGYTDIMQTYADAGCYNKAANILSKINLMKSDLQKNKPIVCLQENDSEQIEIVKLTKEQMEQYFTLFVGREDTYAQEVIDINGRRVCQQILEPLDEEILGKHLAGQLTVSTYVQRNNATVKYLVIDIDISKKVILSVGATKEALQPYIQKAAALAQEIRRHLQKWGWKLMWKRVDSEVFTYGFCFRNGYR